MEYLSRDNWEKFQEKFPDAYNFLVRKNLEGEFNLLEGIQIRGRTLNDYQKKRHEELRQLIEINKY